MHAKCEIPRDFVSASIIVSCESTLPFFSISGSECKLCSWNIRLSNNINWTPQLLKNIQKDTDDQAFKNVLCCSINLMCQREVSWLTTSEQNSVESTLLNKFLFGKTMALQRENYCSVNEVMNHLRSCSTSNSKVRIPFCGRSTLVHHWGLGFHWTVIVDSLLNRTSRISAFTGRRWDKCPEPARTLGFASWFEPCS